MGFKLKLKIVFMTGKIKCKLTIDTHVKWVYNSGTEDYGAYWPRWYSVDDTLTINKHTHMPE